MRGNPLYTLSAFLMLLGCYALSADAFQGPADVDQIALLLLVLHAYRASLVAVACWLGRSESPLPEARSLVWIHVLFLVDGSHLQAEAFSFDPVAGLVLAAVALVLGLGEVAVLTKVTRVRLEPEAIAGLVAALAMVLLLPGVLAFAHDAGPVGAPDLYAAWWIAALGLPVAALAVRPGALARAGWFESHLRLALAVGPCASVLTHLATSHLIYEIPLAPAYVAPLGIGLALAAALRGGWPGLSAAASVRVALALPAGAVALSGSFPPELGGVVPGPVPIALSPLRLTALGAVGALVLSGRRLHSRLLLRAGAVAALIAIGGATPGEVAGSARGVADRSARATLDALTRLIPRTLASWGAVAIAASWALLVAAVARTRRSLASAPRV